MLEMPLKFLCAFQRFYLVFTGLNYTSNPGPFLWKKPSKPMETHPGFWRHFAIEKKEFSSVEKLLVNPGNPLGLPEKTYVPSRGFP
jgi:hypothetical protein